MRRLLGLSFRTSGDDFLRISGGARWWRVARIRKRRRRSAAGSTVMANGSSAPAPERSISSAAAVWPHRPGPVYAQEDPWTEIATGHHRTGLPHNKMPPFLMSRDALGNTVTASQVPEWNRLPAGWLARLDTGAKSRVKDSAVMPSSRKTWRCSLAQLGREDHGRLPANSERVTLHVLE